MQKAENIQIDLVDYQQLQQAYRHKQERDQYGSRISQQPYGSLVFQIDQLQEKNIQAYAPSNKIKTPRDQYTENAIKNIITQPTPFDYEVELISQESQQKQSKLAKDSKNEILDTNQNFNITEQNNRKQSKDIDKIHENQREDRRRRRKQKSAFKDILNGSEGTNQNTKTIVSNQYKNQEQNIEYGKKQHFHQQNTNQKIDIIKNSKQINQLPPLKRQRRKNQGLKPALLYQNDNSIMALQKYMEPLNYNSDIVNHEQGVLNHFAFKPIPQHSYIKFLFKRQKKLMQNYYHPQYSLIFNLNKLVLNARKDWGHMNSHYNISCEEKYYNRSGRYYAGYLKGNFSGTRFNLFSCHDVASELVVTITYKAEVSCMQSAYRQLQVYLKNQDYSYSQLAGYVQGQTIDLKQLFLFSDNASARKIIKLVNKKAEWSQSYQAFLMDFKGKSKMASVKNTILVEEGRQDQDVLILCKVQQNQFYLQAGYPLDPFMAMGIVLSSFDFKLLCQ